MSVISSSYASSNSRPPSLTRESTGYGSNNTSSLPSPIDFPSHPAPDALKTVGAPSTAVRVRMTSQDRMRAPPSRVGSIGPSESNYDQTDPPNNSYFPLDSRGPSTPTRNRSAKDLIGRYEAMSPTPINSPNRAPASPMRSELAVPEPPPNPPLSALKDKGRAPLRDSFRNLISFLGKKGKSKDDDPSFLSSRYDPSGAPSPSICASPQPQLCTPVISESKPPIRFGPILYLARSNMDNVLPVWTNCKASLLEDRILLEWLTAYGNPSSSAIMLGKSTDVHSLAKSQVDPTEKSLLPNIGQDAHIFELSYPGGSPEKFALNSVAERSAWVSSIWDVLLTFGRKEESEEMKTTAIPVLKNEVHRAKPLPTQPSSPPQISSLASSTCMSREHTGSSYAASSTVVAQSRIGPVKARTGRDLSQTTKIFTGVASAPSTPTKSSQLGPRNELYSSRGSSPSIQNLGNLSLVQSRLSQLSDKTNPSVSRTLTQLSRRSSLDSAYSDSPSRAPTHLATPQSLRKDGLRPNSRGTSGTLSKAASIPSNYEEEQSIYDYYSHKPFSGHVLSPVPDVSESQASDTPRMDATPFTETLDRQSSQRSTTSHVSRYHRSTKRNRRSMSQAQGDSAVQDTDSCLDVPLPLSREPSQRTESSLISDIPCREKGAQPADVHPLIALIQDHAVQQYSQTSDIGHQIASLQQDVLSMSADLRAVIAEQEPGTSMRAVLEDLCAKMERTVTADGGGLLELHQKVDLITSQLIAQETDNTRSSILKAGGASKDKDVIMDKLVESVCDVQTNLKNDMPLVLDRLVALQQTSTSSDVSQVNAKLDELLESYRAVQASQAGGQGPVKPVQTLRNVGPKDAESPLDALDSMTHDAEPSGVGVEKKLLEIVSMLKAESESKKLGADQQTENVRYLHELNSWLESFVNNGTTQIQSVAQDVARLCQELAPQADDESTDHQASGFIPRGIRSEMATLVDSVKSGEEKTLALHVLLTESLQITRDKDSNSKPFDMETVVSMIERQRHEQENMLRGIASELSNDIRGERLRFVEAMKEATAINVQVHVEEFKKELGKEVMMMTCEVGRLQRERQMLEQQIADLFAFFAKQRTEMEQSTVERARNTLQAPQQPPMRSNSRGRPLPVPR